jgi:hypothetical protein
MTSQLFCFVYLITARMEENEKYFHTKSDAEVKREGNVSSNHRGMLRGAL